MYSQRLQSIIDLVVNTIQFIFVIAQLFQHKLKNARNTNDLMCDNSTIACFF